VGEYLPPDTPSGLNAEPGAVMELPGWFPKSSQLAFGRPVVVVVDFVVVVGFTAVVVGLAGALMRVVGAGAVVPMRPAANVAAETSDRAHAAAMVVTDFSLRVLIEISPCARSTRAVVRF
jgi:hypothetical protein